MDIISTTYRLFMHLLRLSLAPVLLVLFIKTSSAQNIGGGITVGFNASQVDGDSYAGFNKLGFNAGVIGIVPLNKKFSASLEILYNQKGSKQQADPSNPFTQSYKLRLNYAEVPLLINFQDRQRFNFGTGFSFSRLVQLEEFVNGVENIYPDGHPYRKMDYNWLFNFYYTVIKGLKFNFRFAVSLRPIRVSSENQQIVKQYNKLLTFRLAYHFNRSK